MQYLSLLLLLVLLGCSVPRVISTYNENLNFAKYNTYRVHNPLIREGSDTDDYAGLDELEHAISNEMDKRGYNNALVPDLFVSYRVIIDPKVSYNVNYYDNYYYGGYYNRYPNVRRSTFNEGILMIELTERGTKKMVWQGSLDLKINRKKKNVDLVAESVRLIFEKYYYVAGKKDPVINQEQND